MSGMGKGVVGTVTKPVAGVLDFASGTASAIRDTSKSHIHRRPARVRRPRCCYGHGGLLAPYSTQSAEAQEELLQLNNHNYAERFVVFTSSCKIMLDDDIGQDSYSVFIFTVNPPCRPTMSMKALKKTRWPCLIYSLSTITLLTKQCLSIYVVSLTSSPHL